MDPVRKVNPIVVHEEACELEGWADPTRGGVRWRTLFSADRTESESITCGIAEVTASGVEDLFSVHQHAQPEVYFVLSGEGMVTIDGVEYPIRAGSAVFIPPNALHSARNTGEDPLRLFYVFAVDSFAEVEYVFPALSA
jgi:mannose-6-phosphate isomerase-like protein (cupin superfamily)